MRTIWTPENAQRLATFAHEGQVDQAGQPYIRHLAYVASEARAEARRFGNQRKGGEPYTSEQLDWVEITGWLHDIVEDTDVTLEMLDALGLPPAVHRPVRVLTHDDGSSNEVYWASCYALPIARWVKRADIRHNRSRLHHLRDMGSPNYDRLKAKYDAATLVLWPNGEDAA